MAAQSPPFALQASSHSAELFRRALGSIVTSSGVVTPTDLKVTQNTGTDLKCQVPAGQVWVPGTLGSSTGFGINSAPLITGASPNWTSQGPYYGFNDAAITGLTFSAANASNPRIDFVVATVFDAQYSGATNSFVIQVVTGTPSGSPAYPTIPANSVVLAVVSIAANQTAVVNANITDVRTLAGAGLVGGVVNRATGVSVNGSGPMAGLVSTSETTTSTSATDLATVGPTVATYVPSSGVVRVTMTCNMSADANGFAVMSFAASGANTIAAGGYNLIAGSGASASNPTMSTSYVLTQLTAGLTTFRAKYWKPAGSGTNAGFASRFLFVEPLP